jgi:DNA repair photolyase
MPDQPAFFDFARHPPTTRTIALRVKTAGAAATIDEAQRRADAAHYQEITCRSALNAVRGMPFNWTLNPYRGCTHACQYCFARRYHTQFELGPGDDHFASFIMVKVNLVEVLKRELDKPSWKGEQVAIGTATDPYQPIEGHYKLTRRSLEALLAAKNPASLVTKGPMIVRDAEILAGLGATAGCTVYMSVPSIDDEAWRALEPGTAHPLQRLKAVRQLRDAGVHAGVLMAPVVPGFTTQPAKLEATIRAIADHGAAFVGANVMFLKGTTKDHFMGFLAREFPHLAERYGKLYAGAYAPAEYVSGVKGMIDTLQRRYDLKRRENRVRLVAQTDVDNERGTCEQVPLEWEPDEGR